VLRAYIANEVQRRLYNTTMGRIGEHAVLVVSCCKRHCIRALVNPLELFEAVPTVDVPLAPTEHVAASLPDPAPAPAPAASAAAVAELELAGESCTAVGQCMIDGERVKTMITPADGNTYEANTLAGVTSKSTECRMVPY
jgi:hypothetical protein